MKKIFIVLGGLFTLVTVLGFIPKNFTHTELKLTCNGISEIETANAEIAPSITDEGLNRIHSSPMKNYFYNLRGNYGFNYMGTCAYVGLGMLFTYYDAYYNDNIVPEKYEVRGHLTTLDEYATKTSPGSWEIQQYLADVNEENYAEEMYNRYGDRSLHANLLKLGKDMGYDLGLTMPEVQTLLKKYLADNSNIDNERWLINYVYNEKYAKKIPGENYTYGESMRQSVIDLVNMDIPVYIAIVTTSNKAHAAIAYDYDEDTNTLYAHFGQTNDKTHHNVFKEYDYIAGYITLNPMDLHSHSNNYDLGNSSNKTEICSCKLPNHKHYYSYNSISTSSHKKYCICGYETVEQHKFSKRGTGKFIKYLICENCGHMKLDNGEIISIQPFNAQIVKSKKELYEI